MKISALLPHVQVFGGVRRYLEIGNEFAKRGYYFVLFHPDGSNPEWFDFKGITKSFSSLGEEAFDIGLCSEYSILPYFEKLNARTKFFYFIQEGHKKEKEVIKMNYFFLGNSAGICNRIEKKYKTTCHRAFGGVNHKFFFPLKNKVQREEFHILCYGRIYKRVKRIKHIISAVEGLYKEYPRLRFVFFDTLVGEDRRDPRPMVHTQVPHEFYLNLPQTKMAWLYSQGDIFVSAERRAGWSNTTAEAMACRIPVVCTKKGTRDFAFHNQTALVVPFPHPLLLRYQIKKLIKDEKLRLRIARAGYEKIQEFSWSSLVDRLEGIFKELVKLN